MAEMPTAVNVWNVNQERAENTIWPPAPLPATCLKKLEALRKPSGAAGSMTKAVFLNAFP